MSRTIEIIHGDFGKQTAEFISEGIMQKPAILLNAQVMKKGLFGTRRRWEKVIWPIREHVAAVELLEELKSDSDEGEWTLPGITAKKKSTPKPQRVGEKVSRKIKRVRFKILFKDGRNATAIADARVFQNMFALSS